LHPGQGTANRRFFFRNMMLELLFVDDPAVAIAPHNRLLRLPARCAQRDDQNASPLGVCFRPIDADRQEPWFESTHYRPSYLPSSLHINVASENAMTDPLWFHLPFSSDAAYQSRLRDEPTDHSIGVTDVSMIGVTIDCESLSATATLTNTVPGVQVRSGCEHLLEIEFDSGAQGQERDLRPLLPLVLSW